MRAPARVQGAAATRLTESLHPAVEPLIECAWVGIFRFIHDVLLSDFLLRPPVRALFLFRHHLFVLSESPNQNESENNHRP